MCLSCGRLCWHFGNVFARKPMAIEYAFLLSEADLLVSI
jgi:hypothetical protein